MPFDPKAYMRVAWTPRTASVAVPELKDFFAEGEEAVFTVRGLDGNELARMREEGQRQEALTAIRAKIGSKNVQAIDGLLDQLGFDGSRPDEVAKLAFGLEHAITEPKCERQFLISLWLNHNGAFMRLGARMMELSGEGAEPGKPSGSGKTTASGQTSP